MPRLTSDRLERHGGQKQTLTFHDLSLKYPGSLAITFLDKFPSCAKLEYNAARGPYSVALIWSSARPTYFTVQNLLTSHRNSTDRSMVELRRRAINLII